MSNLDFMDEQFEFGHERSQEFEDWLDEIHSMAEAERIEEEIIVNSHRHSALRDKYWDDRIHREREDPKDEVPF